jgi:hypothetical protein
VVAQQPRMRASNDGGDRGYQMECFARPGLGDEAENPFPRVCQPA